ncbi:MAG: hypothetical protein AAGD38_20235 [Acidobacteriota bacterium]
MAGDKGNIMKVRTPRQETVDEVLIGPTPARAIKDAPKELRRMVKRLQGIIKMHRDSAAHMNVTLEAEDVLAVIDALIAEADLEDPLPHLESSDEIREYARSSLYDEMLGEPSNVLLATAVRADTTRYEAMPREFWIDSLHALRKEWEA